MKFLKLSLAASVALGALSTSSFAQPLEEAIKGVDVSGYLRYRYTDNRYNAGSTNPYIGVNGRGNAAHQWRAVADFKTPTINNIALNLGIWYDNSNNVNHGKGIPDAPNAANTNGTGYSNNFAGTGLGAGSDGQFGVRSFYATITPDNTATTVKIGKQPLDTPITYAPDGDRGTGILVLNNDVPNLTLVAAAFDSWMVNEATIEERTGTDAIPRTNLATNNSIDKNLYAVAGIYNLDTDYGNFGGQLWGFYINNAVDALVFGELSWKNSLLRAKAQYTYAAINNDSDSIFKVYHGKDTNVGHDKADIKKSNDILALEVGANLTQDYQLPLDVRLGYITNFADGTAVALENEGSNVSRAGKVWWDNAGTGISTSALQSYGVHGIDRKQDINVFYAAGNYGFIDNRLNLGLEFAYGQNKLSANQLTGAQKIKFTEITPTITWKHSKNLTLSSYYAYLQTDPDEKKANGGDVEDQKRGKFRVEAKYTF